MRTAQRGDKRQSDVWRLAAAATSDTLRAGMKNLWRALQFFRADLPLVAAATGLLVLSVGAGVLKPWPLALIVDSILGAKPLPNWLGARLDGVSQPAQLAILAGAVLAVHFGQGALAAAHNYLLIRVGLRGLARVRQTVFHWLLRLSMRYHQSSNLGDLMYRATWDTYAFQTLFQQGLFTFITATLSLVLMLTVMARLNVTLTYMAAAALPLLVVSMRIFSAKMKTKGVEAHKADGQVASLIHEGIAALPLIHTCAREETEESRFNERVEEARASRLSQHGWEILYLAVIALVFGVAASGIIWLGARQVQEGQLSVGGLLVFVAYLGQLHEPLSQLSHIGVILSDASAGTCRVFEVLDTPEEVKDAPDARALPDSHSPGDRVGALSFERVSFGYQPEQPILRELTFELAAGESAAVIGPSGAGKTTLLQLLPRFYDPQEGVVRLDGVDLRQIRLRDLRLRVAYVMQEPMLLPGTIAENIGCARPGATMEEIMNAATASYADGFIDALPRRYETMVGEGAARLSVGERQRLNLARAFLKNAPILVLDEPTSALDAESEAAVLAGLEKLKRGRTTLLVTHRVGSLHGLDRILVLDKGRLVEDGRPQDLLTDAAGYYTRLTRVNRRA